MPYWKNTMYLSINPKKEPLTVEQLRTFKGFENLSEEKALHIIKTIREMTYMAVAHIKNHVDKLKNK